MLLREKLPVLLSALLLSAGLYLALFPAPGLALTLYLVPGLLLLLLCGSRCLSRGADPPPPPGRAGLSPRARLSGPAALQRWLRGLERGSPSPRGAPLRAPQDPSESCIFSPRDLLMGSYISRPDSPGSPGGRRPQRNPREQLRERLSRPNHAMQTPNRRLSFSGYVHRDQPLIKSGSVWWVRTGSGPTSFSSAVHGRQLQDQLQDLVQDLVQVRLRDFRCGGRIRLKFGLKLLRLILPVTECW